MAASRSLLLCDSSTLANFIAWASALSAKIAGWSWVQKNDTGQVVWTATVLTLTQVTVGADAVYSYSSYTGPAPRVGMSVAVTGFTNGGNNVTGNLTAVSGGASGTVTMATTTQVNETHAGNGTTTAIAAVPSSTYVYEIWGPGDGGTNFYVKMEYGLSTTSTRIRISLGSGTNGAGTLTGTVIGPSMGSDFGNGGAIVFECLFSGDSGRWGMILWRNHTSTSVQSAIFIERVLNTDGTVATDTNNAGVTLITMAGNTTVSQRTLIYANGAAPAYACILAITPTPTGSTGEAFAGSLAISPVFPGYGKHGNPLTAMATVLQVDIGEMASISAIQYGASRNYLAIAGVGGGVLSTPGTSLTANARRTLMRYD